MPHTLYAQLSLVALLLCCGFAVWKGGPAERSGAIMILATWLVSIVASLFVDGHSTLPALSFLVSDALLASGLLILAVRYSNWWMGAAMLLQAVGLSLHAAYFTADKSELNIGVLDLYVLGKNLASVAMLLVILAGALAAWRKRSRSEAALRAVPAAA